MPRFLTVVGAANVPSAWPASCTTHDALPARDRAAALKVLRSLTESLYPGLDLSGEIETIMQLSLGDTVPAPEP